MILNSFKERSVEKKYQKIIQQKENKNFNNKKVESIAILLDNESLINIVEANVLNTLPFKKNQIKILTFRKFDKKQEQSDAFFTNEDFGFKASLKSDNLKDFVKKEYDLFINYTKESNLYTNMITLLSKSTLKVGFANIDDRLFDLVVSDTTFNEAILNKEVKKYLTILNKI